MQPLWEWVQSCCVNDRFLIRDVDADLRLDLGGMNSAAGVANGMLAVRTRALQEPAFLLEVVDTILDRRHRLGQSWFAAATSRLESLLDADDTPHAVRPDGSGLVRPEAAETSTGPDPGALSTGPGGDHLALAWTAAYSSEPPDPGRSRDESVRAVEAALAAARGSDSPSPTLDVLLEEIEANPAAWTFELAGATPADGVRVVVAMASLLRDTRSGEAPTTVTLPQARAAVHLAATLVAWAADGAFRCAVPDPSG
ncbi:MAG: hypothetical protein QOH37_2107 [Nocardioidaceae bacterium]|nr:hypothetical protein [Nocardioidaceae bacterium]